MPTDKIELDKIFKEAFGANKVKETAPPVKAPKLPDAVVQLTITTICQNCKNEYQAPNPYILYRHGKNIGPADVWMDRINFVKREIRYATFHTAACHMCFASANLTDSIIRRKPIEVKNG